MMKHVSTLTPFHILADKSPHANTYVRLNTLLQQILFQVDLPHHFCENSHCNRRTVTPQHTKKRLPHLSRQPLYYFIIHRRIEHQAFLGFLEYRSI